MDHAPKIESVEPVAPLKLRVRFRNGVVKEYDCGPLLSRERFALLKNPAFFRLVRVDPGGYGVSWNADIDLSEYELWTRGQEVPAAHEVAAAAGSTAGEG